MNTVEIEAAISDLALGLFNLAEFRQLPVVIDMDIVLARLKVVEALA